MVNIDIIYIMEPVAKVNVEIAFPLASVEGNTAVEITVNQVREALSKAITGVIKDANFIRCWGFDFGPNNYGKLLWNDLSGAFALSHEISTAIESSRTRALRLLGVRFPLQNLIPQSKKNKTNWNRGGLLLETLAILVGKEQAHSLLVENTESVGHFEPCGREKPWEMPPTSERVLKTIWNVAQGLLGEGKLKDIRLEQNCAWNGTIDFSSFLEDVEDKHLIGRIIQILAVQQLRPYSFIPDESAILLPDLSWNTLWSIFNSVFPWIIRGKEEPENNSHAIVLGEQIPDNHTQILAKNFRVQNWESRLLRDMPIWRVKSEEPFLDPKMEDGINTNSELYAVLAEAVHKESYLAFWGILRLSFDYKDVSMKIPRKSTITSLVNKLLKTTLGFQLYSEGKNPREIPYYIASDNFLEAVTICVAVARLLNRDILLNFGGTMYQITPQNTAYELHEKYIHKKIFLSCLLDVLRGNGSSDEGLMIENRGRNHTLPWRNDLLNE